MSVELIYVRNLRSSNNGGCVVARLLDLAEMIRGVALHVISSSQLGFSNWRCGCDRPECDSEKQGRKTPGMHVCLGEVQ